MPGAERDGKGNLREMSVEGVAVTQQHAETKGQQHAETKGQQHAETKGQQEAKQKSTTENLQCSENHGVSADYSEIIDDLSL